MKENIKYFETLQETNGYVINNIPFTCYIKENRQVIFNNEPNKMLIIKDGQVIINEINIVFETLNDADGYIIKNIPFSCYIKENKQFLECNQENCKIVVENGVAIIKERGNIIRYTATSKITPYMTSSLPNIISNDFDPNTGQGVIKFEADVESIGNYAFRECGGLISVTIPNSVTSIGNYAFRSCYDLTSVTIPNSVTRIGNNAFSYCTGLTSVLIPNSVTITLGDAFYGCTSLASVTIPNSVTRIGPGTFSECSRLASISYTGTISQYNSITKGLYWHLNIPATVVHCTDGDTPI